jgi:pimeloyl-ACP methyl ester carboxylesterase
VRGLAADVADWLQQSSISPDAVLGHSYGGKVALAMSADLSAQPLQIWVIDSTPEPKAPGGSAWSMLEIVRTSPGPFRSRDEAVAAVTAGGFTPGVAQWMATNLARFEDGFTWRLDFDVMETLMRDFFEVDLWPVVEHLQATHEIHFLKASESSAMSDDAARRVERLASGRVHLHRRQGGHWIHAESPDVVTTLLVGQLPR